MSGEQVGLYHEDPVADAEDAGRLLGMATRLESVGDAPALVQRAGF